MSEDQAVRGILYRANEATPPDGKIFTEEALRSAAADYNAKHPGNTRLIFESGVLYVESSEFNLMFQDLTIAESTARKEIEGC